MENVGKDPHMCDDQTLKAAVSGEVVVDIVYLTSDDENRQVLDVTQPDGESRHPNQVTSEFLLDPRVLQDCPSLGHPDCWSPDAGLRARKMLGPHLA